MSDGVNELINRRGVKGIVSKSVRHAYTPRAKRRKESFAKSMKNFKRKMFGEISRAVIEEVTSIKS